MAHQEIAFKRPVMILQVFRLVHAYGKAERSFTDRKDDLTWRDIPSVNGYVREGALFLPKRLTGHRRFHNCSLITMEDEQVPQPPAGPDSSYAAAFQSKGTGGNDCLLLHRPATIGIFEFRQQEEAIALHLKWGYFEVGLPERDPQQICLLREGQPVEVKINGRIDASLSSGRTRVYKEQQYVFTYLGLFRNAFLLREPVAPVLKQVPADRKTVDLLKPLW